MNDNDIIKALKCQLGIDTSNNCFGCLYRENKSCINASECILEVVEDLISRQKAEIERLTLENKKITETNNALNYQIDTWSPAEAIKEFAEKIKGIDLYQCIEEYYKNAELCYDVRQDWFCEYIDSLVKGMTEAINNAENDTD